MKKLNITPLILTGTFLGIGLGGLIESFIFRGLYPTHPMMNSFWGTIIHGFYFVMLVAGLISLWKSMARLDVPHSVATLSGSLTLGLGLFFLVEGITGREVFHLNLDIQQAPRTVQFYYDKFFLAVTMSFIGIGGFLITNAKKVYKKFLVDDLSEKLKQITDIQPILIGQVDKNLRYMFVNKAYEEWFGLSYQDIVGMSVEELFGREWFDQEKQFYYRALTGERVTFESRIKLKNSSEKHVQATYNPALNADGDVECIFISIADITELKKAMMSLKEETTIKDKFVATLTHDLIHPLTGAKVAAQVIRKQLFDKNLIVHTDRILDNLTIIGKMVEDLLDAVKLQTGKHIVYQPQDIDLVSVIRSSLEDLSVNYGERFILDAPLEINVEMDPHGIRRIIENLCINAVKYGSLHDPIVVNISPDRDAILISVINQDRPSLDVDEDTLEEPYEEFLSLVSPGHREKGIGLTIVSGITQAHGGVVEMLHADHVTNFTIKLPRRNQLTSYELQ
jgi:PAS domain S-box-containing protein